MWDRCKKELTKVEKMQAELALRLVFLICRNPLFKPTRV